MPSQRCLLLEQTRRVIGKLLIRADEFIQARELIVGRFSAICRNGNFTNFTFWIRLQTHVTSLPSKFAARNSAARYGSGSMPDKRSVPTAIEWPRSVSVAADDSNALRVALDRPLSVSLNILLTRRSARMTYRTSPPP